MGDIPDVPAADRPRSAIVLTTRVRVAVAAVSIAMLVITAFAMLGKGLDGAAPTALVLTSAVLALVAAAGAIPARGSVKDYAFDFGEIDQATEAVEGLVAERSSEDVDDEERAEEEADPVISDDDITLPLFADQNRRSRLVETSPKAAILAVFGELEEQLRGLAEDVDIDVGRNAYALGLVPISRITRALLERGWLTPWHVSAINELARVRNTAAHAPGDLEARRRRIANLVEIAAEVASEVAQRRRSARAVTRVGSSADGRRADKVPGPV